MRPLRAKEHAAIAKELFTDYALDPGMLLHGLEPRESSRMRWVKPVEVDYSQAGVAKTWEAALSHDAVVLLIHDVSKDELVLVEQARVPVALADGCKEGVGLTVEACAGILEHRLGVLGTAAAEALQECGYRISESAIERVAVGRAAVGVTGSRLHLLFASATSADRVAPGGGLAEEGEHIGVLRLPAQRVDAFLASRLNTTPSTLFLLQWFQSRRRAQAGAGPSALAVVSRSTAVGIAAALAGFVAGVAVANALNRH